MFHFVPQAHCVNVAFPHLNMRCAYLLLVMSDPAQKLEPRILKYTVIFLDFS